MRTGAPASERQPRPARTLLGVGLGMLVAGALYLYAVRGMAIFLDLPSMLGAVFCM